MNDWVRVDASDLAKEELATIRGIQVKVSVSPYDIPTMVRGYRKPNSNFFVIEFQYLTEEPVEMIEEHGMQVEVGCNSGRIYRINVDVVKHGCDAVGLELGVKGAIRKLGDQQRSRPSRRYLLAENVIERNKGQLFSDLHSSFGVK